MKSINTKIFVSISLVLFVVFTLRYFYILNDSTKSEIKRLKEKSISTSERLAQECVNPILNKNIDLIKTLIKAEAEDTEIRSVQILNANNTFYTGILSTNKGVYRNINGNKPLFLHQDSIARNVYHKGQTIGKIIVYPDYETMEIISNQIERRKSLEIIVFFLIVIGFLFFLLRALVIKPVDALNKWISSVNANSDSSEFKKFDNSEFEMITNSISKLKHNLDSATEENRYKDLLFADRESLMANLPKAMVYRLITGPDGYRKFTYLSGSFEKIYGFPAEEAMLDSSRVFKCILKEDIGAFYEADTKSKSDLSPFTCEVRMVNADGTVRYSRFGAKPAALDNGFVCWDGVELDITDSKKTEAELHHKTLLLESISNGLPDNIFAKDLNGRYLFVNSGLAKRLNTKPHELLGKTNSDFLLPDDAKRTMAIDLEIMSSGISQTYEEKLTMNSIVYDFYSTKGPIKDSEGKIIGVYGISRDITDRKKAEEALFQKQFLLESISNGLPDNVFAKDLKGNYLFVNSALVERANKKAEAILGQNNTVFLPPEDAIRTMAIDAEVIRTGKIHSYEEKVNMSASIYNFYSTKGPIKDSKGNIVGLFGISRDISDRKKAEEELKISQEKFEFAFNSSPNAIFIQDEQTSQIIMINDSFTTIFGYTKKELHYKTPLELKIYKDLADRERLLSAIKKDGYIRNMEIICYHKSGSELYLLFSTSRHYFGNKPYLYINLQDITERKKMELELQKLNLDKDRFISVLSHDLRGPINSTISLLDIVNANIEDMELKDIKEIVDTVHASARKTSMLLEDVLMWATAKSGKMKFKPQMINLKETFSSIIELLQLTATNKNIDIKLLCEDSAEGFADKNMLDTILRNLISNAIKFTRESGKIIVAVLKDNKKTLVSVTDNGVGIEPNDIGKIFDKTQLFTSIGTSEEKGTGFGLKLCLEFVEKHHGEIWVESEVGTGTAFYFSLPNAK